MLFVKLLAVGSRHYKAGVSTRIEILIWDSKSVLTDFTENQKIDKIS
jgi:hypothetical protein